MSEDINRKAAEAHFESLLAEIRQLHPLVTGKNADGTPVFVSNAMFLDAVARYFSIVEEIGGEPAKRLRNMARLSSKDAFREASRIALGLDREGKAIATDQIAQQEAQGILISYGLVSPDELRSITLSTLWDRIEDLSTSIMSLPDE